MALAIRGNNSGGNDSSDEAVMRELMAETGISEDKAREELGMTVAPSSAPVAPGGGVVAPPSLPRIDRSSGTGGTRERVEALGRQDGALDIERVFEAYTKGRTQGAAEQYKESSAALEDYFRNFDDGLAAAFGLEQAP